MFLLNFSTTFYIEQKSKLTARFRLSVALTQQKFVPRKIMNSSCNLHLVIINPKKGRGLI